MAESIGSKSFGEMPFSLIHFSSAEEIKLRGGTDCVGQRRCHSRRMKTGSDEGLGWFMLFAVVWFVCGLLLS
jgi:hypothetical protein